MRLHRALGVGGRDDVGSARCLALSGEHSAGLEKHLQDENDESCDQTADHGADELQLSKAGSPAGDVAPVTHRYGTEPHDGVDGPFQRQAGELGYRQEDKRGYGEEKEPRFVSHDAHALVPVESSSFGDLACEARREDVGGEHREDRSEYDADDVHEVQCFPIRRR